MSNNIWNILFPCVQIVADHFDDVDPNQLGEYLEYDLNSMSPTRAYGLYECTLNSMADSVIGTWIFPYYDQYKSVLHNNSKKLLNCIRNYHGEEQES